MLSRVAEPSRMLPNVQELEVMGCVKAFSAHEQPSPTRATQMPKLEPTGLHLLGTCIFFKECYLGSAPGDLIPRGSKPKEVLRCLFLLTSKVQSNYVRFPKSSKPQVSNAGRLLQPCLGPGWVHRTTPAPQLLYGSSFHGFHLVGNCLCPIPTALLSATLIVSFNTDVNKWGFYIVSMQITNHKCASDFVL